MATQLHILTRAEDTLAATVIAQQRGTSDMEAMVVDLTEEPPDYAALLEKIFTADSVAVW